MAENTENNENGRAISIPYIIQPSPVVDGATHMSVDFGCVAFDITFNHRDEAREVLRVTKDQFDALMDVYEDHVVNLETDNLDAQIDALEGE